MADHLDPNTASNCTEVAVEKWHWQVTPDFNTKILRCSVMLELRLLLNNVQSINLDTKQLQIFSVVNVDTGENLSYSESAAEFGSLLQINIPKACQKCNEIMHVSIDYSTSPEASAVQWLTPTQTAGKCHPYLFTQCQAIHARSMLPCQDTPYIKSSYVAEIIVSSQLTALMSARMVQKVVSEESNKVVYKFEQAVPVPSYLVALVVGALECRKIGPRSSVWSEREIVEIAANEFEQTEDMLKAAEDAVGPYVWGRYDLLVLPPSFPYGGMENPCLTFVTPTVLAGDRSQTFVIAHEISHSWTGNLVTNCSWEHFWLNEGFTTYLERRIIARLYGERERQLHAICGWKSLEDSVNQFGENDPRTALCPKLQHVDPDDAFSAVPYEKGFNLLYHLEILIGGPDVMEGFLKAYINHFQYMSLSTDEWKQFFLSYFKEQADNGMFNNLEWDRWLYGYGMPPVIPSFDTYLADVCYNLADKWAVVQDLSMVSSNFSSDDILSMSGMQIQVFLNSLLSKSAFSKSVLQAMDKIYHFSQSRNCDVTFRWLRLLLKAQDISAFPSVVQFVTKQGRMKYVRPLYRELFRCPGGDELARNTFQQHKDFYHTIAASLIEKDLGLIVADPK